jgi:hypothetical protein
VFAYNFSVFAENVSLAPYASARGVNSQKALLIFLVLLCQHRYFLLVSFDDRYLASQAMVAGPGHCEQGLETLESLLCDPRMDFQANLTSDMMQIQIYEPYDSSAEQRYKLLTNWPYRLNSEGSSS